MATINNLSFDQTPNPADQVPIYAQSSGTTQRTSINLLLQVLNQLPTVQPAAGSGELWIDTTAGNVIKVAL
jgi:methylaspartate ammonia-lyase